MLLISWTVLAQILKGRDKYVKNYGVDSLHGSEYQIIPDRIEAGTYMCIAAAVGEEITINNIVPKHVEALTVKLKELGVDIQVDGDAEKQSSNANHLIKM